MMSWTFPVPGTGNRNIRSGAALDPNNSTVYFQCNDGFLYAVDANTGGQRWRMPTGNTGGPLPAGSLHDQPLSSSPVVDASGNVYVSSANGHVFRFNPSNGAQLMEINVGQAVEASLAIGNNGWIYG